MRAADSVKRRGLRVVLLTKRHPLSYHLATALAERGYLKAVLFERGMSDTPARWRYVKRYARRFGLRRTVDFVMYELVEQFLRAGAQRRAGKLVSAHQVPEGIPVHDVDSCNSPASRQLLESIAPDVLVVHATGILTPETVGTAPVAINVHGGVLPEYRGHASTFWALKKGDLSNIGVTLHEVAPKVDTGRIFRIGRVTVTRTDDDLTLWHRAIMLGSDLLIESLDELAETGRITELSVPGQPGPHYPRRGLVGHLAWALSWPRARRTNA